jgi:hypothetical protein
MSSSLLALLPLDTFAMRALLRGRELVSRFSVSERSFEVPPQLNKIRLNLHCREKVIEFLQPVGRGVRRRRTFVSQSITEFFDYGK